MLVLWLVPHPDSVWCLQHIISRSIPIQNMLTQPTRWKICTTTARHQNRVSSMMTRIEIIDGNNSDIGHHALPLWDILFSTFYHQIQIIAPQVQIVREMKSMHNNRTASSQHIINDNIHLKHRKPYSSLRIAPPPKGASCLRYFITGSWYLPRRHTRFPWWKLRITTVSHYNKTSSMITFVNNIDSSLYHDE